MTDKDNQYDLLFTLNDEKNGVKYAICTNNTKDKDGNAIIYLGKYKGKKIVPLTTKKEEEMLKEVVSIVQKEVLEK